MLGDCEALERTSGTLSEYQETSSSMSISAKALATLKVASFTEESSAATSTLARAERRACLHPDTIRSLKLAAGDWMILRSEAAETTAPFVVLQLWPKLDLDEASILIPACHLQILAQPGVVTLHSLPPASSVPAVGSVVIVEKEVLPGPSAPAVLSADEIAKKQSWTLAAVKESLLSSRYVTAHTQVSLGKRHFSVKSMTAKAIKAKAGTTGGLAEGMAKLGVQDQEPLIYEMDWKAKVEMDVPADEEPSTTAADKSGVSDTKTAPAGNIPSYINIFTPTSPGSPDAYLTLGGLSSQINLIRSLIDLPLLHPHLFSRFGLTPPRGILLHGPPGTGKTALARAIASSSPGCSCIVINGPELSSAYHGETEERLRNVFIEAERREPCIVVLDEVDALCPRRDGGEGGEVERRVVATLLTLMDGMGKGKEGETGDEKPKRVVVIAATNRPNGIDPALRRPGRFDREIEIGIPDATGRLQILEILMAKMPNSVSPEELTAVAARTHGYVGADLSSLVRESASLAIQRWITASYSATSQTESSPLLTSADLLHTLPQIRPSAMREVFLETPSVRWSDIGGQDDVKQKLRECVEWPLTHAETFKRLGVEAPRGVLLYGPPGCSKTLTAKALATESGINFIAVKGPELLNKYVGESERAVREIFRKARAASPSIIFFDEIDALGASRTDGGHDGPSSGVLTSLLNEMDGIEELSGVTVVAATNRPDVLDSALMRPGRLDRILYVGAPDLETRKDIFRIRLATMAIGPDVSAEELALLTDGCSGAEVVSICQDAAMTAMNEDLDAPFVKREHFVHSAKTVRRRITPDMIEFFEEWRDQSGVRSI